MRPEERLLVLFIIPIVFGFIGGFWAAAKQLNPIVWGVVCGLLPVIGLVILAFQKSKVAE